MPWPGGAGLTAGVTRVVGSLSATGGVALPPGGSTRSADPAIARTDGAPVWSGGAGESVADPDVVPAKLNRPSSRETVFGHTAAEIGKAAATAMRNHFLA